MKRLLLLVLCIVPFLMSLALVRLLSAAGGEPHNTTAKVEPITVCTLGCDYDALQPAVNAATPGASIVIAAGNYSGVTIVDRSLTIAGAGALSTTLDGVGKGRVLEIQATTAVTVSHLTISDGLPVAADDLAHGGGILNLGSLRLVSVTLLNNAVRASIQAQVTADAPVHGRGGGIYNGCLDGQCGRLVVVDSSFIGNDGAGSQVSGTVAGGDAFGGALYNACDAIAGASAELIGAEFRDNWIRGGYDQDFVYGSGPGRGYGGAIYNDCGPTVCGQIDISDSMFAGNLALGVTSCYPTEGYGGAIFNDGRLSLDRVTLAHNVANSGGDPCFPYYYGNSAGGAIFNSGRLTITATTMFANRTDSAGGALYLAGGHTVLINSTLSGNAAYSGVGGGIYSGGTLLADYVTIVDNEAGNGNPRVWGRGGGIYSEGAGTQLSNSILADNIAPAFWDREQSSDCYGPLTSLGYNLVSDDSNCALIGDTTGNLLNQPAHLGPLADNGGPTMTHGPLFYSPVLNTADPKNCPAADQRGAPRPAAGIDRCDIGAYEGVLLAPHVNYFTLVSRQSQIAFHGRTP